MARIDTVLERVENRVVDALYRGENAVLISRSDLQKLVNASKKKVTNDQCPSHDHCRRAMPAE